MMTSDNKVGGWVKKGQNHDDVILERSLRKKIIFKYLSYSRKEGPFFKNKKGWTP